jgi:methionine aminopeptidase
VVGPARGHAEPTDRVIQPGDVVRIDFGITHRGYSTDAAHRLRAQTRRNRRPAELKKLWDVNAAPSTPPSPS